MNLSIGNYNTPSYINDSYTNDSYGKKLEQERKPWLKEQEAESKPWVKKQEEELKPWLKKEEPEDKLSEKADKRMGKEECETCKNRKYQDGSDEMVSFKSPAHISPTAAASAVRAHEQEHVTNAYSKAATGNGKVINASVTLHTDICPECGRTYVSGGTTNTQIKYYNEDNPYQKDLKSADRTKYSGMNVNYAV